MKNFIFTILFFSSSAFAADSTLLQVNDPWVRQAPPGMQMLGAFLKLKNVSDQTVIVVGSQSSLFAKVEIHRTEIANGQARMLRQKQIEILPGEEKIFEPGGLHLMLMKPKQALSEGTEVSITLELENGEHTSFIAPVKRGTMP